MRLREIQIRDFRKLRSAYVKGLTDGANVIAGHNEAGKSTVLSALQTALFQRHNITGKLLDGIQPYGCSVRPEVDLAFELDGRTYRLHKTFGGSSGKAELVCPDGKRFMNHDARPQARGITQVPRIGEGCREIPGTRDVATVLG